MCVPALIPVLVVFRFPIPNKLHNHGMSKSIQLVVADNYIPLFSMFSAISFHIINVTLYGVCMYEVTTVYVCMYVCMYVCKTTFYYSVTLAQALPLDSKFLSLSSSQQYHYNYINWRQVSVL